MREKNKIQSSGKDKNEDKKLLVYQILEDLKWIFVNMSVISEKLGLIVI